MRRINPQIFLAIMLFSASLGVLLFDHKKRDQLASSAPIGVVVRETLDLKRRLSGELEWSNISDDEKLFAGDRIFTNEKSTAQLELFGKLKINLNELTLIQLNQQSNQIELEVGQGGVTLELGKDQKEVSLKIGKKTVKLKGSSTKTNVSVYREKDDFQVVVNNGFAEVSSDSKIKVLTDGDSYQSKNDQETFSKVCEQYLFPIHQMEISQPKEDPILFQWKDLCDGKAGTLEISKDSRFQDLVYSSKIQGESQKITLDQVRNGPLYWRISRAGMEAGLPQTFILKRSEPPVQEKLVPVAEIPEVKKPEEIVSNEVIEEIEEDEGSDEFIPQAREPSTEIKKAESTVTIPEEAVVENTPAEEPSPKQTGKKISYSLGVGISGNTYKDSTVSVQQLSVTPKVALSYRIPGANERFRIGLNAFFSALPINSTKIQVDPSDSSITDDVTVRYLGINAKVAYLTPWLTGDWRLELSAGWYYNSIFVTQNYFGYEGVNGPEFFPSLEKDLKSGSTVGGYFKFCPISGGGSVLDITSNYEMAFGIYYSLSRRNKTNPKWSFNLDFAHLSITPSDNTINVSSLSLGTSISF